MVRPNSESEQTLFLPLAAAYDRWAPGYDVYDNPLLFAAGRVIERWAETVAGATVVEFGCGTGRNLARLGQAGAARLIGCDLSAGMLARARARGAGLLLFRHDITQPAPLAGGIADLVLFCLALEHVGDLAAPLAEARRLLRPGGRVVVIEIHPFLAQGDVQAHFRDGAVVVRMPTFAHRFADHLNAAAAAGLTVAACREWRPRDCDGAPPPKLFKRGPDQPVLVEFTLAAAAPSSGETG
ncbi:class I SAM-dependent methyltransferase [Phaeospirillum tilakii]|uniref:Class I SAM-dependent methyltransferase n=1 Tax=Phaeospirillum tilakii TaxID=741673 RepID=A0ABW5CAT4_9PROT